jgi:UDP-glucose 4-epimerase
MRYSIFGAGFIGISLIRDLLKKNHKVSVLDRNNCPDEFDKVVEWHHGDFSDSKKVSLALEGSDVAYNFIGGVGYASPKAAINFELDFTHNIEFLNTCIRQSVKKVIFASSASVYGLKPPIPITESSFTDPISIYGIGKLTLEKLHQLANHVNGLSVGIARIANPYGPGQFIKAGKGFIPIMVENILAKTPMTLVQGDVVRDFYYIEDLISDLQRMSHLKESLSLINCGSGKGYSLLNIIHKVESLLNFKLEINWVKRRAEDIPYSVLDKTHSNYILGRRNNIDISEGLSKTLISYGL